MRDATLGASPLGKRYPLGRYSLLVTYAKRYTTRAQCPLGHYSLLQ